MSSASAQLLDRLLDPIGKALGPDVAQRVLDLRADPDAQRRIDELADKANEGLLSPDERGEYESLLAAATVIGVLQAKARVALAGRNAD